MPTETITLLADTTDGAAEQIIHLLQGADNQGEVIYFHGWFGFGASAVLKAVVKRLRLSSMLPDTRTARDLGKIIHIDVSQWQSKRALQRVIAEELELPPRVMAFFDQHDEDDDFDGVEQSARGVIRYVKEVILNELMACNFLVVLHNGSGSYIDLWEAGVPVMGQLSSKRVLWTSRGRFWHHNKDGHSTDLKLAKVDSAKLSDIAIITLPSSNFEEYGEIIKVFRHALYAEAKEVAKYTGVPEPDMSPKMVIECILYRALRDNGHNLNWEAHASNYWVCDGIIQDGTDGARSAWEISDALHRNVSLDFCSECTAIICEMLSSEQQRFINRWVSLTNQNSMEVQLTSQATSLFWTGGGLEACMFEHSNKTTLRVIHLSHCTFSFSSPPFRSCRSLRFLLLDHCKDKDGGEENDSCHHLSHHSQEDGGAWFQNLWVLELSYTDWYWLLSKDMLDLMVDLKELNVKGVGNRSISHLYRCSGARSNNRKLLKLQVVAESYKDDDYAGAGGDIIIQQVSPPVLVSFPDLSSWHILKTIILDGCGDLEVIGSDALPLSLELFSLTSNETSKIKCISFRGRTQLKGLLLRGLFDNLEELDMSGTAIKMLDLSATRAKGLKRLFLLGCAKLHAILWPQEEDNNEDNKVQLEVLCIDTTMTTHEKCDRVEGKSNKQQETTASDNASIEGSSSLATLCGKDRTIIDSDSYISIRDPRLFRSLLHLRHSRKLHVEISSTSSHKGAAGQEIHSSAYGQQKPTGKFYADDIISTTFNSNSQADGANRDLFEAEASTMKSMWLWYCPPIPMNSDWTHCYISIQDEKRIKSLQGTTTPTSSTRQLTSATTLPAFVHVNATTLHLHDSLSITCLPGGPAPAANDPVDLRWDSLRWCRLERCPNLEGIVFTAPPLRGRDEGIFCYLRTFWASQLQKARYIWYWSRSGFFPGTFSFVNLVFLHIDNCPRLVHVLPLYASNSEGCCSLKTLEIVCCGDLREVFPSDSSKSQQHEEPREFSSLERIHLYELPKLQRICGRRMLAPSLETVKVRGCWGLKRLPAVGPRRSTPPVVDCEKDWWDGLEWDGESAGHHPSHYKPSYSAYYKEKQLRASVLR